MKAQYEHFQAVLGDSKMLETYTDNQINHMEKYTQEFIGDKQKEILD